MVRSERLVEPAPDCSTIRPGFAARLAYAGIAGACRGLLGSVVLRCDECPLASQRIATVVGSMVAPPRPLPDRGGRQRSTTLCATRTGHSLPHDRATCCD